MKKALLSFALVGVLVFGSGNVFAAPAPKPMKNQPVMAQHQQPRHNVAPRKSHIAPPPPKKHIAHKPHRHLAHQPYYYNNYGYNNGFALKVGNLFLSI